MQTTALGGNSRSRVRPPHVWLAAFAGTAGLAGAVEYLQAEQLAGPQVALDQLFSYRLTAYAQLMVLGSTVLYLVHLRLRAHALGLWASALAGLGALGLLGAVAARATETHVLHRTHHIPLTGLHEVMALFSACTILVYLVIERAYRSRAAGAFVMPIVAAAVLFEAWLMASGGGGVDGHFPMLHTYTVRLHVLVNFAGYGAFAVAAAMGLLYALAVRGRPRAVAAVLGAGELPRLEALMHRVVAIGFVLFSAALLLGMQAARDAWGSYWTWNPKESWALLVWASYGGYLYMQRVRRCGGVPMARWSVAGFVLSAVCFLGVNLLAARGHAYG